MGVLCVTRFESLLVDLIAEAGGLRALSRMIKYDHGNISKVRDGVTPPTRNFTRRLASVFPERAMEIFFAAGFNPTEEDLPATAMPGRVAESVAPYMADVMEEAERSGTTQDAVLAQAIEEYLNRRRPEREDS